MKAYDFYFQRGRGLIPRLLPVNGKPELGLAAGELGGWCGGRGPILDADQWPRSRVNGYPMIHVFTTRVPADYRRRGADWVGLSFFQADDHVADSVEGVSALFEGQIPEDELANDSFLRSVQRYIANRHPNEYYMVDIIGGGFAAIWLSPKELRGRASPPPDDRTSPRSGNDGRNAWDNFEPEVEFRLVERLGDPNVGITPVDVAIEDDCYIDIAKSPEHREFFERALGRCHFGGTSLCVQAMPKISPYFIELEEIGGANFGGGNCQICLETMTLDWACG